VGREGDPPAAAVRRHRDRAGAEQLHHEPEAEQDDGRQLHDLEEDPGDQRQDARMRIEHEVAPMTPAIAPLAPMVGSVDCGSTKT
jgi:hypothetical protein